MRAVIQRVSRASVTLSGEMVGEVVGEIGVGLLVLLGIEEGDTQDDVVWMANKVVGLRVFADAEGKMNLDVGEVGGSILAVSQFTLLGDCRKGRRPSFVAAAGPEEANALYRSFVAEVTGQGLEVQEGRFQQQMDVELVNDGPVTLQIDSRHRR